MQVTYAVVFCDLKTARILSTILIFIAVLAFLHGSRETLTLFLFSILFCYFVEPLVALLDRLLHGRVKAIVVTYLLLGGVLTALVLLLGPGVADEAKELTASLPALLDRIRVGTVHPQVRKPSGLETRTSCSDSAVFHQSSHRNLCLRVLPTT